MRKRYYAIILLILLLTACGGGNSSGLDQHLPAGVGNNQAVSGENSTGSSGVENGGLAPVELSQPDCYGPGVHPVGESIAEQFEETNYTEVMTWFCSGAEFDDILVALQTEKLSNQPAEDLLERLANGESWDEIFGSLGLN